MTTTRALVWDVGNVLLDWSPDYLYHRLIPDADARAAFFARLPFDQMNLDGDRDGDLQAKVEAMAAANPDDAALILPWWAGWDRMCGGLLADSVALRDRMRASGVATWGLTNFAADSWLRCVEIYPELTGFDGVVVSGREGVIKPDPAIYRIALEAVGVPAERAVFVDDFPGNVQAAEGLGMLGILVEDDPAEALAHLDCLLEDG